MEGFYLSFGVMSLVFFVIGSVFLVYGIRRARTIRCWEKTTGVIVKKEKILNSALKNLFQDFAQNIPDRYPTVKYTVNGNTYTNTSKISQHPGMKPGKEVEVKYNPDHPEQAVINTFVQRGSFFTLIGAIFFTIACILFIVLFIVYHSQ